MKKHLTLPSKLEEDASDAISTATNNSGHHSNGEHSPAMLQNLTTEEADSLCDGSKKIRKKRNTYQKIDDDVRLKLLDAVKHGETLKSAAKKYKINYSSAKSILHTYRKEGRILKKSAQERNIKRNPGSADDVDGTPNHMSDTGHLDNIEEFHVPVRVPHNAAEQSKMEVLQENSGEDIKTKPISPAHGLVDNIMNLLKLSANSAQMENVDRLQSQMLKTPQKIVPQIPKTDDSVKASLSKLQSIRQSENAENSLNLANLANLSQLFQGNSLDNIKALDSLCSNFSSSLLSGANKSSDEQGKDAISPESAGESAGDKKQGEEICVPHPLRFNTAHLLQEKVESKLSNNGEDGDWDMTIENAAIDTFKSFMDAQLLLCDALKKASYLNSLMQAQKSKEQRTSMNEQL